MSIKDSSVIVEALGKRFPLESTKNTSRSGSPRSSNPQNFFNALSDVSFKLNRGDSLGIIGSNGSGKSTLLKILARVILPSSGKAILRGRVNSLLELGTGFQRELTGRENIYLNASIIGMSREETRLQFEDIVSFAGIHRFVDEPVRHYSSGMYSRLAFSVAAHAAGDILLIDEVFAVGDAEFSDRSQKKINKMISDEGRTVLFVSHSIDAVLGSCNLALWLEKGRAQAFGTTEEVVSEYLKHTKKLIASYSAIPSKPDRSPLGETRGNQTAGGGADILAVVVGQIDEWGKKVMDRRLPICIRIDVKIRSQDIPIFPVVHLHCGRRKGVESEAFVFSQNSDEPLPQSIGEYTVDVEIPGQLLTTGQFSVSVGLGSLGKKLIRHSKVDRVITFSVIDKEADQRVFTLDKLNGPIQPKLRWSISPTARCQTTVACGSQAE